MIRLKSLLTEQTNYPEGGHNGTWAGSATLLIDICKKAGLPVSSPKDNQVKRSKKTAESGNITDHWIGAKNSAAFDFGATEQQGNKWFQALCDAAVALKAEPGSDALKIDGKWDGKGRYPEFWLDRYRIQILWKSDDDHYDHVHIGIRNFNYNMDNATPIDDTIVDYKAGSSITYSKSLTQAMLHMESALKFLQDIAKEAEETGSTCKSGSKTCDFFKEWKSWNPFTGGDKEELAADKFISTWNETYRNPNMGFDWDKPEQQNAVTKLYKTVYDFNMMKLSYIADKMEKAIREKGWPYDFVESVTWKEIKYIKRKDKQIPAGIRDSEKTFAFKGNI